MMERSGIMLAGKKTLFVIVYFLFLQNILFAKPSFPELTGRVVDKAQILSQQEEENISILLKDHENSTSNQIVIVTLNTLEGYDIADFGYQLGRHWGIGQKDKNNGILLIIAMSEKKIRIEVGYGLEGTISDKTAHEIIEYILKPNFRQGSFYNGINKSLNAIIKAVKGEYKSNDYRVLSNSSENYFFVYFAVIFLSGLFSRIVKKYKKLPISNILHSTMIGGFAGAFAIAFFNSLIISGIVFAIISILVFLTTKKVSYSSSSSSNSWDSTHLGDFNGGFSSGGSFGGGFSGSGGNFGGGGASGGW